MSEQSNQANEAAVAAPAPSAQAAPAKPIMSAPARKAETQEERWLKYGANVLLTTVAVIALAAVVVWAVQRQVRKVPALRMNFTGSQILSLKPQTVSILDGLKGKVRLVSLYPNLKQETDADAQADYYQTVADLLDEYRSKGKNVETDLVDPANEPAKLDALIKTIIDKYGGNVKAYRDLLESFPKTIEEIKKVTDLEVKRVETLQKGLTDEIVRQIKDENLVNSLNLAFLTVQGFPQALDQIQKIINDELKRKLPDYKGAVSNVEDALRKLSRIIERVVGDFDTLAKDTKSPKLIRDFMSQAAPELQKVKKQADDLLEKVKGLGDLKLDEIRTQIKPRTILVMNETDIKVIPFDAVWKSGGESGFPGGDAPPRMRFAGEQAISAAMLSMAATGAKPKVAFIRPGGPPLATESFGARSYMSVIAQRLRDYNFEVLEKDISGQWAMQARMQQRPAPPEPSDEEIKDALWVVLSVAPPFSMMGPNPMAGKVAEHLKQGGSALVLFSPQSDNLEAAIKEWGVEAMTDRLIVHEKVKTAGAMSDDFVENAQRMPLVFILNQFGDHPITRPLRFLDGAIVPMVPIRVNAAKGYKSAPLIPVPTTPMSWAEKDLSAVMENETVEYNPGPPDDPNQGDLPGPFFAGAAVEKENGGRLVVLGSWDFARNGIIDIPDQKMLEKFGVRVSRLPANAELFCNSVFWLMKMEPMIALSPAAMEVSRIKPMSSGMLGFWRIGMMLLVLPGAVIAAGVMVYFARRD